jgi:hypothetical protein
VSDPGIKLPPLSIHQSRPFWPRLSLITARAMAVTTQPSMTSLSNYSILQEPNVPRGLRDFCNSFWGEADEGATVLLTRMRTAIKTSEELQTFWTQR